MQTDFETAIEKSELPQLVKTQVSDRLKKIEAVKKTNPAASTRDLVKEWSMSNLKSLRPSKGNKEKGKQIFIQAQCANCHRMSEIGSTIGPDLTNVAGRFNQAALLESILEPSRQIDPKYALSTYATIDGKTHTGRVHGVNSKTLTLEVDPILQTTITLNRDEIESTRPAKKSPMPTGLLNYFNESEINDLLAFLLNR